MHDFLTPFTLRPCDLLHFRLVLGDANEVHHTVMGRGPEIDLIGTQCRQQTRTDFRRYPGVVEARRHAVTWRHLDLVHDFDRPLGLRGEFERFCPDVLRIHGAREQDPALHHQHADAEEELVELGLQVHAPQFRRDRDIFRAALERAFLGCRDPGNAAPGHDEAGAPRQRGQDPMLSARRMMRLREKWVQIA